MTPEEKTKAKDALRVDLYKMREDTLSRWIGLFKGDESWRRACGYSKGPDEMLKSLVKDYEQKMMKLMAPFDRGDFD